MKVNGKEIKWEDGPKGHFWTDVKVHTLWEDKNTGANLTLLKAPKSETGVMGAHVHTNASDWSFYLAGEVQMADGTRTTVSADNTFFSFVPKGESHGKDAWKAIRETTWIRYHDGGSKRVQK